MHRNINPGSGSPGKPHVEAMRLQRLLWDDDAAVSTRPPGGCRPLLAAAIASSRTGLLGAQVVEKPSGALEWSVPMVIRHVFSLWLSGSALLVIIIGVSGKHAVMPGNPLVLFLIFLACVTLLGYLEGLQVAILALEKMDCAVFRESHARGYRLISKCKEGRNVERFLVGRQFFVIFVVYLTAQITTFPDLPIFKNCDTDDGSGCEDGALALPDWLCEWHRAPASASRALLSGLRARLVQTWSSSTPACPAR